MRQVRVIDSHNALLTECVTLLVTQNQNRQFNFGIPKKFFKLFKVDPVTILPEE